MQEQFIRTSMLIGNERLKLLSEKRVAIFGIGGVGGFTVEALARSGVGTLDLIDNDTVNVTNINRQIIALHSTLEKYKVDAARDRVLDINPEANVNVFKTFYTPETDFDFSKYDYIVDAIDTVSSKIDLVIQAQKANIPIISSMGAGNKLSPEKFEVADIYKTSVCPLAKIMRYELRKRRVEKLKVVYSKEPPIKHNGQRLPASIAFVPSVVGLIIAGEVIKDLIK